MFLRPGDELRKKPRDYWETTGNRQYLGQLKKQILLFKTRQNQWGQEVDAKCVAIKGSSRSKPAATSVFGATKVSMVHQDFPSEVRKCGALFCEVEGRLKCGQCRTTVYCSTAHQRQDWETHRRTCRIYEHVVIDGDEGRTIAVAKFPVGYDSIGTVLEEAYPLVILPQIPPEGDFAVCIACCQPIGTEEKPAKCADCFWPVCYDGCNSKMFHTKEECEILAPVWHSYHWTMPGGYECLWMIRILTLRETDPQAFKAITDMKEDVVLDQSDIVPGRHFTIETLRHMYGIHPSSFTDDELSHIWYVLRTKCLKGCMKCSDSFRKVKLLCREIETFEHSCCPNAAYCIDEEGKMIVSLQRPVQAGWAVTISYDPSSLFLPTFHRRVRLMSSYKLVCCCERCMDPTELGTHYGGIPCHSDKGCGTTKPSGYLYPVDSTDSQSNWKCSTCANVTVLGTQVQEWLFSIKEGMEDLLLKQDAEYLCFFLEELISQKVLHETHHLVFEYFCEALKLFNRELELDSGRRAITELLKFYPAARSACKVYRAFLPTFGSVGGPVVHLCALIKIARLLSNFEKGTINISRTKQDLERYVINKLTGKFEIKSPFGTKNWHLASLAHSIISRLISSLEAYFDEKSTLNDSESSMTEDAVKIYVTFLKSNILDTTATD